MSEATIVSLVPTPINESKPGLYPGFYQIPPVEKDDFHLLHIEDACYYIFIDDERGSIKVPVNSHTLAESICKDYIGASLEVTEGAQPGLFWIPGRHKKDIVALAEKEKIKRYREMQTRWLMRLILLADDDWQKYHQFRSISDLQRKAAEMLEIKKPWLVELPEEKILCPVCRTALFNDPIICATCQVVLKPEEYKKFSFVTPHGASVSSNK